MILVELSIPRYVYQRLKLRKKDEYKDVIKNIIKPRGSGTTFVLLEESPKGWWVALQALREGPGKIYIVREVNYMDVPSKVIELSFERKWNPKYESVIEDELRRWGLKYE